MLIHVEGFENMAVNDFYAKYPFGGSAINGFITGRIAGKAIQNYSAGSTVIYHVLATPQVTIGSGWAFNTANIPTDGTLCAFYDVSGNVQSYLRFNGSYGFYVERRGGGRIGDSSRNALFVPNTWGYLEVEMTANTVTGRWRVRFNGELLLDVTADTIGGVGATIGAIELIRPSGTMAIDDWYIYDKQAGAVTDFLGDCVVYGILPDGAGSLTQWSVTGAASNYAAVNGDGSSGDAKYVASSTPGQIDRYTFSDIAAFSGTIKGIQVTAQARKDDAGSRSFNVQTKSGAAIVDGVVHNLGNTYLGFYETFEKDPNTGAAWTRTNLNAAEFGVKLVS